MELKIIRKYKGPKYTIGSLFLNNKYFCDTLEDVDRNLSQIMSEKDILSKKIYGETAIPTGIYKINITYSNKFGKRFWAIRFGGKLPLIEDVKGFEGIRIHPGNTNKDTLGCILVGCNKKVGELINSQYCWTNLMLELTKTKEDIELTIK